MDLVYLVLPGRKSKFQIKMRSFTSYFGPTLCTLLTKGAYFTVNEEGFEAFIIIIHNHLQDTTQKI